MESCCPQAVRLLSAMSTYSFPSPSAHTTCCGQGTGTLLLHLHFVPPFCGGPVALIHGLAYGAQAWVPLTVPRVPTVMCASSVLKLEDVTGFMGRTRTEVSGRVETWRRGQVGPLCCFGVGGCERTSISGCWWVRKPFASSHVSPAVCTWAGGLTPSP